MDDIKKIERLFNIFIKNCKIHLNEYDNIKNKVSLYENLLDLLNSSYEEILKNKSLILILLDKIYEDKVDLSNGDDLLNENEILNMIVHIEEDYEKMLKKYELYTNRIEKEQKLEFSARMIRNSLKYHKLLNEKNNDVKNAIGVLNILREDGNISDKEYLLLTNVMIHYNEFKLVENGNPEDMMVVNDSFNEISNMALMAFQGYKVQGDEIQVTEKIEVGDYIKGTLDSYVDSIKSIVDGTCGDVIKIIDTYIDNEVKEKLETNEYNYIVVTLMNLYLEELIGYYSCLFDECLYTDLKSRNELVRLYYNALGNYLKILNYYNDLPEWKVEELKELSKEFKQEKRLIYSRSEVNEFKEKFISDMSNLPYEYYEKTADLLERFKKGTLQPKEIKVLKNHKALKGHIELRDDQVRIIIRHVKDDIYCVLGVATKKDDNDIKMYRTMTGRANPNVSKDKLLTYQLELSKKTEEKFAEMVLNKKRKGTR